MGNPIQFDYSLIIPILVISLGIFVLVAYSVIQFLKRKAMNDKELLQKMEELIKTQKKSDETS